MALYKRLTCLLILWALYLCRHRAEWLLARTPRRNSVLPSSSRYARCPHSFISQSRPSVNTGNRQTPVYRAIDFCLFFSVCLLSNTLLTMLCGMCSLSCALIKAWLIEQPNEHSRTLSFIKKFWGRTSLHRCILMFHAATWLKSGQIKYSWGLQGEEGRGKSYAWPDSICCMFCFLPHDFHILQPNTILFLLPDGTNIQSFVDVDVIRFRPISCVLEFWCFATLLL